MKQKGFSSIILLIILLLGIGGLYLYLNSGKIPNESNTSQQKQFIGGSNKFFSFSYPSGWQVLTDEKEALGSFLRFELKPEPNNAYISGSVRKVIHSTYPDAIESTLANEVTRLLNSHNISEVKKLDWETGDFEGLCFEYIDTEYSRETPQQKITTEKIKCFIKIKTQEQEYTAEFFIGNKDDLANKYDPDREIAKTFFASLGPQISKDKALDIVNSLPDVVTFRENVQKVDRKVTYNIESKDKVNWFVEVFEEDSQKRTIFNRYLVDKETGKVIKQEL